MNLCRHTPVFHIFCDKLHLSKIEQWKSPIGHIAVKSMEIHLQKAKGGFSSQIQMYMIYYHHIDLYMSRYLYIYIYIHEIYNINRFFLSEEGSAHFLDPWTPINFWPGMLLPDQATPGVQSPERLDPWVFLQSHRFLYCLCLLNVIWHGGLGRVANWEGLFKFPGSEKWRWNIWDEFLGIDLQWWISDEWVYVL